MPESNPASNRSAVHIFVSGHVQGVGFRYFVQEKAEALGLVGWVRNLPDRRVEAEAAGERAMIEQWLELLQQGNSFSRVENVNVQWIPYDHRGESFKIA